MANKNEAYAEMYTGNFLVTRDYLGAGPGVPGSGSWSTDYYAGPYKDWKAIIAKGQIVKKMIVTDSELNINYTRLGYIA